MEEPNKASVSHDEAGVRCRSHEFSNQLPGLGKIVLLSVHSCPRLPFKQNVFAFDAQRQSDSSPSFLMTRRHEIVGASEVAAQASATSLAELDDPTRFAWRELHRSSDLMYWIEQKDGGRTFIMDIERVGGESILPRCQGRGSSVRIASR